MTPNRDDFFVLIHKAQRRELFAIAVKAGSLDWEDSDAAGGLGATWTELRKILDTHAAHEEKHFFPLLADAAPQLVMGAQAAHEELGTTLDKLTTLVDAAATTPTMSTGLAVYREMSAFVANYLLHLLEEETVVMPAIWEACSDEQISQARRAFLADQSPAGAVRSRRIVLPAVSPQERSAMAAIARDDPSPDVLRAFMDDAEQLLGPADWLRLRADVMPDAQINT